MAELRHSWSMGNRTAAISSSSPAKRDSFADSKPLFSSSDNAGECHRSWYLFFHRSSSLIRSALESPRGLWILIAFGGFLIFLGFMFMLAAWSQLSGPYLCYKDEINLQCPRVNEARLLWENPHASTTSWKPCAEWRENGISDLLPENETSAYIFIHAEGGLNQQRIAICNALAVAKIMNATLILPVLKQDQIWKERTNFEDIFDVDHFIEYLKDDVCMVRDIPDWFTDKAELFTSIRCTVKNIPKYVPAQFYIDNVLPRIKEKKIMALKPFVDRLRYDNVPPEINRLRCRVNYHALKFLPEIEEMANLLSSRMRNRSNSPNPYIMDLIFGS